MDDNIYAELVAEQGACVIPELLRGNAGNVGEIGTLLDLAADEIDRLRAELAEAKRDVDRINWMEKNKVGIYAAQSSVRATTGPRYFKPWKFCGWSAANRDDELPTVREAIDAAMAGGA